MRLTLKKKSQLRLTLKKSGRPKLVLRKTPNPEAILLKQAQDELNYFVDHRHNSRMVIQKYIELFGEPPKGVSVMLLKARVWYRLLKLSYTEKEWNEKDEMTRLRYRAAQHMNLLEFDSDTRLLMKCDMLYQEGTTDQGRIEKMKLKISKKAKKEEEKKDKKSSSKKGAKIGKVLSKNLGLSVHYTWVYGLGVKKLEGKQLVKFMEHEYPGRKTDWAKDVERRQNKLERGGYDKDIKKARELVKGK